MAMNCYTYQDFHIFCKNETIQNKGYLKVRQSRICRFFQAEDSSKINERTNEFDFITIIPQFDLFSFVFWKKLKTPKRHLEIN